MKKIWKVILYVLGGVFSTLIILFIIISISTMRESLPENYKCWKGGGSWESFPSTCHDECYYLYQERACGDAFTLGCDCGPNLCWDGTKCISNTIVCKTDEDCKKNSIETRCDYKTKEECENSGGNWVIPMACAAIGCPIPGPPYCECDAKCIDNMCV